MDALVYAYISPFHALGVSSWKFVYMIVIHDIAFLLVTCIFPRAHRIAFSAVVTCMRFLLCECAYRIIVFLKSPTPHQRSN